MHGDFSGCYLTPLPQTTDSPQETLVRNALHLWESKVNCHVQNFVHWPSKKKLLSPVGSTSPWQTTTPPLLIVKCFVDMHPPSLAFWSDESSLGSTHYVPQWEPPGAERSLHNFSHCPWEPGQPPLRFPLPTYLVVVSSTSHWL